MRLLHLSDLHLGRRLCEADLFEDQKYILDQIVSIALSRVQKCWWRATSTTRACPAWAR